MGGVARAEIRPPSALSRGEVFLAFALFLPIAAFPFLFAVIISFQRSNLTGFEWGFDLDAWRSVFETGRFDVVLRTLRIAATVALIATAISVPASFVLCRMRSGPRSLALALITAPFFVDLTSRMFSLRIALSRDGLVEGILAPLGVSAGTVSSWMFGEPGILLGMLSAYAAAAVFPSYISMSLIHPNLLDAGRSLGCSEWQLARRVLWPLAFPGIACGFLLCLLYGLGDYIVPATISGDILTVLGSSIQSAVTAFRYPIVGALTVILFGWMLALVVVGFLLARMLPALAAMASR